MSQNLGKLQISQKNLSDQDPFISQLIAKELQRQELGLEMIASENYVSLAVLQAQGSILTNKYAEGYPGKRYYGGCEFVDSIEQLAIQRAQQLFSAEHVNVQPHSGSQANMAAYLALANPGDKILGLDLSHGGHLTHGASVNFSGILFEPGFYTVDPQDSRLNYNSIEKLALKFKPQIIVAGYSAYPRSLDFSEFRQIADKVGAKLVVDMAHFAGLVATGFHMSPLPYADIVTTTTHKTLRGPRGGMILCKQEYEKVLNSKIFPGIQGGPLEHVIAAKAVAFAEALQPEFKAYIQQVLGNAHTLAESLLEHGFDLVTGGTDNHLILMDLRSKDISGKDAEAALGRAGITVNKNTVPNETRSYFITSGIRIGTPALTTRGMKEAEMKIIAGALAEVLNAPLNESVLKRVSQIVNDLCLQYPMYGLSGLRSG